MRSIWKGHIRFSLVTIPIRVYNAIETSETLRFNQLHKGCNGPVGYDKRCKKCNERLSNEDIVKGYQYEPGQYVVLEPSDFDAVKLKTTKVIEVTAFTEAAEVPATLYESPYFIGPDGEVAAKAYSLLQQALRKSGRVGVGKVVLRDREDVVLLSPHEEGIVMYRLRYPQELRKISEVPQVSKEDGAEPAALKLATDLVETMAKPFAELEFKDTYQDALKETINAKLEGKEVVSYEVEPAPAVDIMTALKQSIQASKKPMVKATGEKKAKAAAQEEAQTAKPAKARKRKAA